MGAWYEKSFGKDYLTIYKHRNQQNAYEEVRKMIEWLSLPKGSEVFDLCCGTGRHSLALADFGYQVTGMDLSETLLAEARRSDTEQRITWLHGDMRNVPLHKQFDAVVNLFTSFGYFPTDDENLKVFQEISRLLKSGHPFIVDYLNPDYVAEQLVPYSEREVDGVHIVEQRSIERTADGEFVVKKIEVRDHARNETRNYLERVKLYGLHEMQTMMQHAGLRVDQVFGDYDQGTYDQDKSPRMILVGASEGRHAV